MCVGEGGGGDWGRVEGLQLRYFYFFCIAY